MAKRPKFRLKESVLRRLILITTLGSVVALGVGGCNFMQLNTLKEATPTIRDIQSETTLDSRAEFYAKNFFLLWISGTPEDKNTLSSFYTALPLNDLNSAPVGVDDINVADKKLSLTEKGQRLWTFTLGATVYSPGITQPSRMFYEVSLIQDQESFSIVKLPEAVNFTRPSISADSAYVSSVPQTSPLYQLAVNFSTAFLTQNNSGSLGRYVSADFTDKPLQNSPYTAADVTGAYLAGQTAESMVEAGTPTEALFRVRVSTSHATYVTMDLTVTVIKQANGQWLVDSLSTPTVGNVTEKK